MDIKTHGVHFRAQVTIAYCLRDFLCCKLHQTSRCEKSYEDLEASQDLTGDLQADWRVIPGRSWKPYLGGLKNLGLQTTTEHQGSFLQLLCSSRSWGNSNLWNRAMFTEGSARRPCVLRHETSFSSPKHFSADTRLDEIPSGAHTQRAD